MTDDIPTIKPIKLKEYEVKQSKYNVASKLPIRSIILGPSGSGKSILLQNMILDIYINNASHVYLYFHRQLMLITRHGSQLKNI